MGGSCSTPIDARLVKAVVVDHKDADPQILVVDGKRPETRRIFLKYNSKVQEVKVDNIISPKVYKKGQVVNAWILPNGDFFRIHGDTKIDYSFVTHSGTLQSGGETCIASRYISNISCCMLVLCTALSSGAAVVGLWMLAAVTCICAFLAPALVFSQDFNELIATHITHER